MPHRILLAGPSRQQLLPFAMYLRRHGYVVRTVWTGLDCLASLRDWHPDLMVMSPDMCWGSGLGVLGVMYEEETVSIVPVVLLVDDPIRVRTELRPEWHCDLLYHGASPDELTEIINDRCRRSAYAVADGDAKRTEPKSARVIEFEPTGGLAAS